MKTKNAMQLKAIIKNEAVKKHVSAQLVMQNYMLERLLARMAFSEYRLSFIIKGGFLISAMLGLDTRTTMDLDTTVKGLDISHSSLKKIFKEICEEEVDDDIVFSFDRTENIRETDEYPGVRVYLLGVYDPIRVPITVDVTTGDRITPKEIEYGVQCMFDDEIIKIMSYNIETILAEKIESIMSRGVTNTRPRDYYDVYTLYRLKWSNVCVPELKKALENTAKKRKTEWIFEGVGDMLETLKGSKELKRRWDQYSRKYEYAKDITYSDVMDVLAEMFEKLDDSLIVV